MDSEKVPLEGVLCGEAFIAHIAIVFGCLNSSPFCEASNLFISIIINELKRDSPFWFSHWGRAGSQF